MAKAIFLDQDETLGEFLSSGRNFYPGVGDFLANQKRSGADLYLASTGSEEACREIMADFAEVFTAIFGRERIGENVIDTLFLDQDGWPQFVEAYYAMRIDLMREEGKEKLEQALFERDKELTRLEQARLRGSSEYAEKDKEFARLRRFSERLLHRRTKEPFDENSRYQNPYLERQHTKDLHLARRWIAGSNFAEPYAVMVGDTSDKNANLSDPSTPVVVVSNAVRRGNWVLVENILDVLLHSAVEEPLIVYDCLYRASPSHGDRRSVAVEGIHYVFEVETFEGVTSRRVYCP